MTILKGETYHSSLFQKQKAIERKEAPSHSQFYGIQKSHTCFAKILCIKRMKNMYRIKSIYA